MAFGGPLQLEQMCAGDENAIADAVRHFLPVIRRGAESLAGPVFEFEDAVQEGLIGLFRAARTYDFARGASFGTYASACIWYAQVAAARAAGRKKHGPLNGSVPLEDGGVARSPEELTIENEQYLSTLRGLYGRLSPFERQVLVRFLTGEPQNSIAAALGRNPKAVENAMGRVRRKFRAQDLPDPSR